MVSRGDDAAAAPLVALLACVAGAGAACAACGGVEQVKPRKDVNLGRAPIAIGDSPMLLALPDLAAERLPGQRPRLPPVAEGLALIRKLRRKDHLPKLVVIALGSNGSVTKGDIARRARHRRQEADPRPGHPPRDRRRLRPRRRRRPQRRRSKHKNRIVLLDWVKYSAGHPAWFQPDGLHLTFDGAEAMARPVQAPAQAPAAAALIRRGNGARARKPR